MTMHPPDCAPVNASKRSAPVGSLESMLRILSVVTMLMTVPQVLTIWVGGNVGGISLISWGSYLFSACLLVFLWNQEARQDYLHCLYRVDPS